MPRKRKHFSESDMLDGLSRYNDAGAGRSIGMYLFPHYTLYNDMMIPAFMQDTDFCCSCRSVGGMRGEDSLLIVRWIRGRRPEFEYSIKVGNVPGAQAGIVPIGDDDVRPFMELFEGHGIASWGELPEADEALLDVPNIDVMFSVDGTDYGFDLEHALPEGSGGLVWKIRDMLFRLVPRE